MSDFSVSSNQTLENYFREISEYSLLNAEDEVDLAQRIKQGDQKALNRLVNANLRFVVSVAKSYQNHGLSLEDLINEGNLGLMKATYRFDETRGFKFISYAVWWIKNAIGRAVRSATTPVRLPSNRMDDLDMLHRSADRLSQHLGRDVSTQEAAENLNMSHRRTEAAITARGRGVSLEAPIGEDENQTLYERIPDPGAAPDDDFVERETAQRVRDAIEALEPRDAEVVTLTFGFHGEPLTLSQAGERFGISKERVRQIRNRAVKQIRDNLVGVEDGAEWILQDLLS